LGIFLKRIVIQNLNKFNSKQLFFKDLNFNFLIEKYIGIFKKEIYYKTSILLINIILNSRNSTLLFGKFLSFFFKLFYKSKRKISKFFSFIRQYLKLFFNLKIAFININGIKIQIKGRFSGAARSSSNIFQIGSIPLQTVVTNVSYRFFPIFTKYGVFGVKLWVYN
jgi:hypothetical protein